MSSVSSDKLSKITNVASLCELFRDQEIDVFIPGGNKGDGLIYFGGQSLFKQYNIKYTEHMSVDNIGGRTLFVYGSGGFNKIFNTMVYRLPQCFNKFDEIYILPSSFECECQLVSNFIKKLPHNVVVFAREMYSYEQLKTIMPYPENLKIDNDLAFNIDFGSLRRDGGEGTLLALRTDSERLCAWRNLINIPISTNTDISLGEYYQYMDVINTVNKYDTVITDRAHVAISSAMLGKLVHILPNNYHKVKGIYMYSLKNMENVIFHEDDKWF